MVITAAGMLASLIIFLFFYAPNRNRIYLGFVSAGIMILPFVISVLFTFFISENPVLENKSTISDQYVIEKEDFDKITIKKKDCKEPTIEIYRYYSKWDIVYSFCAERKEAILYVPKGEKNHENTVE